jgi:hypothetical protein
MQKYFVLESGDGLLFGEKWSYAEMLPPINLGESERCPKCGAAVSDQKWEPPHRVKMSTDEQEKWGDLLWGVGFRLIVTRRFLNIFKNEGLKGITKVHPPVHVIKFRTGALGQTAPLLPTYHLVDIPWGGANQDDSASEVMFENPTQLKCTYCRQGVTWRKQERVVIENGSWNGADIFIPRGAPVPFMVSERFKKVAEENGLTNGWFIPAESYAYDERRPGLWYIRS